MRVWERGVGITAGVGSFQLRDGGFAAISQGAQGVLLCASILDGGTLAHRLALRDGGFSDDRPVGPLYSAAWLTPSF